MLTTNKSRLTSKAQLCIQRASFLYNIYATNWIFIFLAPKLSFRKKHSGKQRNILVYEFADFFNCWQKEKITPKLRDDWFVKNFLKVNNHCNVCIETVKVEIQFSLSFLIMFLYVLILFILFA